MILSFCKMFFLSIFFVIILVWQEELPQEKSFQFGYHNTISYTYSPQDPPSIKLNESATDCLHAKAKLTKCYPNINDCSGFWLRECLSDESTLQYILCPGNLSYNNKFNCYGTTTGCCEESIDCSKSNRTDFSCVNPVNDTDENGLTYYDFPDEHADWKLDIYEIYISTLYPLALLAIQIVSSWLAFKSIGFGSKSKAGLFGIDLALGIPATLSIILIPAVSIFVCNQLQGDFCALVNIIPAGLSWNCGIDLDILRQWEYVIQVLLLLAELWISRHIWTVKTRILENTDKLFHYTMYHPFLMEQSLMLQRRQTSCKTQSNNKGEPAIVQIKACATMWHESKDEIKILLQSVDDVTSHLAEHREIKIDWETHVFFDDAFNEHDGCMNSYVLDLIQAMTEVFPDIPYIRNLSASYGGSLTWAIHGSKFVCHLKDKKKIRNKKRWSQCMYFSYFSKSYLHKSDLVAITVVDSPGEKKLDNQEYVLALDGDISFKYNAVKKLVDMALKSDDIGAVCGQIHPTGSGYMTLYQEFEYQTGHWLQKSTESILGNVLCSPGCFSLIRLKAIISVPKTYKSVNPKYSTTYEINLQKSVLERYLTEPTEPKHYVQYDQGEDRWLCTLLIERGWKIQYTALSMCKTACPTSFDEFFNQRRRWSPSTVANLWDLLYNGGPMLLKRGYISIFHILFQGLALSSAAIGPGSTFLLLVGGTKIALNTTIWSSMGINLFLFLIFLLVSIFAKRKYHILVAKSLGLLYGLLMVVILISMIIEFKKELDKCYLTPPILSLAMTVGSFLFVALLHLFQPPELSARFFLQTKLFRFGLATTVFYISIPSMYLLLPLYCVFNLDDISWGTREDKRDKKVQEKNESANSAWNKLFRAIKVRTENQDLSEQLPASNNLQPPNTSNAELFKPRKEVKFDQLPQDKQFWDFILRGQDSDGCNLPNYMKEALKPHSETDEEKKDKSTGLQAMRTEIFLVFIFLNAGWMFGIFWMQQSYELDGTFGLDWQLCPLSSPLNYNESGYV